MEVFKVSKKEEDIKCIILPNLYENPQLKMDLLNFCPEIVIINTPSNDNTWYRLSRYMAYSGYYLTKRYSTYKTYSPEKFQERFYIEKLKEE